VIEEEILRILNDMDKAKWGVETEEIVYDFRAWSKHWVKDQELLLYS